MLTELGKVLRVIRINREINAKDMAMDLSISASYLSAIENGTRSVPDNFLSSLLSIYQLSNIEMDMLNNVLQAEDVAKLDISVFPEHKKKLLLKITQHQLTEEDVSEICKKLEGKGEY